ncbi:MAG: hypothetical protein L0332_12595 [Chloroflexi bacterium]|nr:hypothetical protein [Chloroflexota bacterium]MCI0727546.1 hypothetical protein [Chloroflexota bacterium]
MAIQEFFSPTSLDLPALAHFLDDLEPAARLQQVRSLEAPQQARLFDAAEGFRPVRLTDFVPAGTPPLQEVIHYGRNSLPIFHFFEKRFCRPEAAANELWGYNEWRFRALSGPGYFVARPAGELEVVIDYTLVPPDRPASWPPIRPNSAGLSRFIYYQTRDFMRGVSQHVTIGRATRQGQPLDNWFVLCRSES